jgi:putative cell wall-binding protein
MKLIYLLIAIMILICTASAQLVVDKNKFDLELHPGEAQIKVITLKNMGTTPIYDVSTTPVGGDAKELIYIQMPTIDEVDPEKEIKDEDRPVIPVVFVVPPETKPGNYTGYMYILDNTPPSVPIPIEFNIDVIKQESYGLDMLINDAASSEAFADPNEPAQFDLSVRNLGEFKDVALINATSLPQGWSVTLFEGDSAVSLPYSLPIESGDSHDLKVQIMSPTPGAKGTVELTATSLGNSSKSSKVSAFSEFGIAIRGYEVNIDVPGMIIVNKTYSGAVSIVLNVDEIINISMVTPPELMAIPNQKIVVTTPEDVGVMNFTMLATQPGLYSMVFKLQDSNGVSMPDEMATLLAVMPNGTAVLTSDDFAYKTIASLSIPENASAEVVTSSSPDLSEEKKKNLLMYSKVLILGGNSVISNDTEKSLNSGQEVKRIDGNDLGEASWKLISELWQNGTSEVVMSGPSDVDIFKGYEEAKNLSLPLVVGSPELTNETKSTVKDLMNRENKLSRILVVGNVSRETAEALANMGISVEGMKL